jgi:transcriptional regulator with XRE-family HTH domain
MQPEDVGITRGRRRRTPGLRREEVAELCSISPTYYSRLERRREVRDFGPRPSRATLAGIARALRFTRSERDRLFAAAGYGVDEYVCYHVDPGVMLILGRLADTPAHVVGPIGEVLAQTPAAMALFGDLTVHTGRARSGYYRWFTRPGERERYPVDEHHTIGAEMVADLRQGPLNGRSTTAAADLTEHLLRHSDEFRGLWQLEQGRTMLPATRPCRIVHPVIGVIELQREVLVVTDRCQRVVIYYGAPGTGNDTSVQLLAVIGHHRFDG